VTILYSVYTGEGLIWAADRVVLSEQPGGGYAIESMNHRKIFRVPSLGDHNQGGLVGHFGQARVGNSLMSAWLPGRINTFAGSANVADFAVHVVERYTLATTLDQRRRPCGFHIGGFERRNGIRVPVFYFARNAELNDVTGRYEHLHTDWRFEIHEQCLSTLTQAFPPAGIREGLRAAIVAALGTPMWYRNGDVPGFANTVDALEAGIRGMLAQRPGYSVPATLPRWERLAKLFVIVATASTAIYYVGGPPRLGGAADTLGLPWADVPAG
jgi:hypothetical protein